MKNILCFLLVLYCLEAAADNAQSSTSGSKYYTANFADDSVTKSKRDVDAKLRGAWVFSSFKGGESNKVNVAFIEDLRKTGGYECLLFSDPARTRDPLGRIHPRHASATEIQRVYSITTERRTYLYRELQEPSLTLQTNGFEVVQFQKDGTFVTYLIFSSAWEILIRQHGLAGVIPKDDASPILVTAKMDEVVKALDQIPNSCLMAKEKWKRLSDLDNLPVFTPEDRRADLDRRSSHDINEPLPGAEPDPP